MKNSYNSTFLDKYLGSLMASAIGDALGWPQEQNSKNQNPDYTPRLEFCDWTRETGSRFHSHKELIKAGEYSDDTQLMLATARSLIKKEKWYLNFAKVELPFWILYERGGGRATKSSCKSWSKGKSPWKETDIKLLNNYYNSGGNGVVMRILPHVYHTSNDRKKLHYDIFRNGIATHGHPRALLSSLMYAEALLYLINKNDTLKYGELINYLIENEKKWAELPEFENMNDWLEKSEEIYGESYISVWEETLSEIRYGLFEVSSRLNNGLLDKTNDALEKLGCFDKEVNGSGVNSVLIALYIFSKFATNPQTGILEVAFLKNADTDTLASLVGGLFGSLHGTEWIPTELRTVQDYDYIKYIVSQSSEICDKEITVKDVWLDKKKKKLIDTLKTCDIGSQFKFFVLDGLILKGKYNNESMGNNKNFNIETFEIKTVAGQTIYIKSIRKKVDSKRSSQPLKEIKINVSSLVQLNEIIPNIALNELLVLIELSEGNKEIKSNNFLKKLKLSDLSLSSIEKIDEILVDIIKA